MNRRQVTPSPVDLDLNVNLNATLDVVIDGTTPPAFGRYRGMLSFHRLRVRFHTHARGSAMEAAAALDTLRVMKLVTEPRYVRGIELLEGIVAMLTKMT